MHPEDLGPVEVTLQVHRGVVSVELTSASAAARDALSSNLGELRSALSNAGLQLGNLDVGNGRGNGHGPATAGAPRDQALPADDPDPAALTPAPSPTPGTGVDLQL